MVLGSRCVLQGLPTFSEGSFKRWQAAGKREGSHLQWAKGKRKKGWGLLRGRTLSLEASRCSRALGSYVATTSKSHLEVTGTCEDRGGRAKNDLRDGGSVGLRAAEGRLWVGGEAQRGRGARQRLPGRARGRAMSTDGQTQGRDRRPGRGRRGARLIQPDRSSVGCDSSSTEKQILKGLLGESVTPTHTDTVSITRNTFFPPSRL